MQGQLGMHTGCRVVAGTILVLAGGALALADLGVLSALELQRSWPVFLIVAGIAQLAVTIRLPHQRGWALLLLGDFFFVNTMTDWKYGALSWPFLMAGWGAWMIVSASRRSKLASTHVA